jgi:hypothetical protein
MSQVKKHKIRGLRQCFRGALWSLILVSSAFGCQRYLFMNDDVLPSSAASLFQEQSRVGEPFQHGFHESLFKGKSCDLCHKIDEEDEKRMAFQAKDICATCHAPGLFKGYPRKHKRIVKAFDHELHLSRDLDCRTCHQKAEDGKTLAASINLMNRCINCHRDRGIQKGSVSECATCHGKDSSPGNSPDSHQILVTDSDRKWPSGAHEMDMPPDHTIMFRRGGHQFPAGQNPQSCILCHEDGDSCNSCHRIMRPRDHGIRWRRTSHGRAAAADRRRCSTCHNADDDCAGCHEAAPFDHTFAFRLKGDHKLEGRLKLRSCVACHDTDQDCQRCHFPDRR